MEQFCLIGRVHCNFALVSSRPHVLFSLCSVQVLGLISPGKSCISHSIYVLAKPGALKRNCLRALIAARLAVLSLMKTQRAMKWRVLKDSPEPSVILCGCTDILCGSPRHRRLEIHRHLLLSHAQTRDCLRESNRILCAPAYAMPKLALTTEIPLACMLPAAPETMVWCASNAFGWSPQCRSVAARLSTAAQRQLLALEIMWLPELPPAPACQLGSTLQHRYGGLLSRPPGLDPSAAPTH